MPLGKTLLIANPTAQNGAGADAADRVAAILRHKIGRDLHVELTEHAGHAAAIAAQANEFDTVIACGGDGIAHEVANGIMRITLDERPALGVVPAGSGNDYAFSLGMSRHVDEAAQQLLAAPVRPADVGICNGQAFVETLSFGLDAAIALDTMERRKHTKATGTLLYLQSGIDQLLHRPDMHDVEIGFGSEEGGEGSEDASGKTVRMSVVLAAVQVGPTYGGGFRICPHARFDDGLLDVCFAQGPVGLVKAALVFLLAKNGHHLGFREISSSQARSVHLRFSRPVPAQIDGERITGLAFDISIEPAALRVIAPSGSYFS